MTTMDALFSDDVSINSPTSAPQGIEKGSKGSKRGGEALLTASPVRAFSSLPGLLSCSVELRSLKGYRFSEDLRIAHA
jgi:hypothetical protein